MSIENIINILDREIGLDPAAVGKDFICSTVKICMRRAKISDLDRYSANLSHSPDLIRDLIEKTLIPETWFFRNMEAFESLARYLNKFNPGSEINILCLPCATGEEPYALAIYLLDQGFPMSRLNIHGADLSRNSLKKALAATYDSHSFRGNTQTNFTSYFKHSAIGIKPVLAARKKVSFFATNPINNSLPVRDGFYQAVFCRNMLIYLTPKARAQVLAKIHCALDKNGLLFTGNSEYGCVPKNSFKTLNNPDQLFFQKISRGSLPVGGFRKGDRPIAPAVRPATVYPQSRSPKKMSQIKDHIIKSEPGFCTGREVNRSSLMPELDLALSYADQGRITEAKALCAKHLPDSSVPGWYLLGATLCMADADYNQAENLLRKTLYLEPEHGQALYYMALILERKGLARQAGHYRKRARRVHSQNIDFALDGQTNAQSE